LLCFIYLFFSPIHIFSDLLEKVFFLFFSLFPYLSVLIRTNFVIYW
jgi:hypothetical protein